MEKIAKLQNMIAQSITDIIYEEWEEIVLNIG